MPPVRDAISEGLRPSLPALLEKLGPRRQDEEIRSVRQIGMIVSLDQKTHADISDAALRRHAPPAQRDMPIACESEDGCVPVQGHRDRVDERPRGLRGEGSPRDGPLRWSEPFESLPREC